MKKLTSLLALFVLLGMQVAFAQERNITGTVIDSEGQPIPGANVVVKELSGVGTITDFDGNYSLNVPAEGQTLVISAVGLTPKEIPIGSSSVINATLTIGLDIEEVVVTGYTVQKKREIAGSISSVGADQLERRPVQSLDAALQGQASGVSVTSTSGSPGAAVQIRIRGTNSINAGNDPLFIVDGVLISSGDQSILNTSHNALASINPSDIEDIQILKDAASAAIYGAQAANGVVIITTKQGRSGKAKFTASYNEGRSDVIKKLDILSGAEWVEMQVEGVQNRYFQSPVVLNTKLNALKNQYGIYDNPDGSFNYDSVETYNWADEVFRQGKFRNAEITASGGTENSSYYASVSYHLTEGQVIESDFERINARMNFMQKLNSFVTFRMNNNMSFIDMNTIPDAGAFANPYNAVIGILPTNPIYNEDGTYSEADLTGMFTHNVVTETVYNLRNAKQFDYMGNADFTIQILPSLTFRTTYGANVVHIMEEEFWDPRVGDGATYNGLVQNSTHRIVNLQTEQIFTYNKMFNDLHDINLMGGGSFRQRTSFWEFYSTQNVPHYSLNTIAAGAEWAGAGAYLADSKVASLFASAQYVYNGKYIVKTTVRRDGSSRFGDNKKFGVFPSFQVAWQLGDEEFMKKIIGNFTDQLKLRASYGITGNSEIGDYNYMSMIRITSYGASPALYPDNAANSMFSWEEVKGFDVGIDYSFNSGRFHGSLGYYSKVTTDMLLDRPLPQTSGFGSMTANVGELTNAGYEADLNIGLINKAKVKWDIGFNYAYNKNEITALVDSLERMDILDGGGDFNGIAAIGYPIYVARVRQWAGVNPADGRPMWYDKDGNITYSPVDDDRVITTKGAMPWHIGGFNTTLNVYDFTISALFQYALGHEQYWSFAYYYAQSGNNLMNQLQSQYDKRWQQPGDVTWVAKPLSGNAYGNGDLAPSAYSSRNLYKMDYLRMKNLEVRYNMKTALCQKLKFQSLQVYAVFANWLTVTSYPGYDPELSNYDDWGNYPQPKTTSFGIEIAF